MQKTEIKVIVAHDLALESKRLAAGILHTETYSKRRLCQQFDETKHHIITACPVMAIERYIKRHDRV